MDELATNDAVALLTVMGLPGSGKTKLCQMLCRAGGGGQPGVHCAHLEFDLFVPDSLLQEAGTAAAAVADDAATSSAWKRARDRLLRSLDRLLHKRLMQNSRACYFAVADADADSESWDRQLSGLADALLANQRLGPRRLLVLLLDDNFYYASMRHAVFQLARFYNCGYGTVYMKASMGQLKLINAVREKPVPAGVIERMSKRLEAPNPEKNPWEKYTCVLSDCDMGFLDDVGHYSDTSVNGRLHALIRDCLDNPFEPIDTEEAARQAEEARETCSLSLLHQADLRLRAIVSEWLAARDKLPEAEKIELGRAAASSKRTLMNALRDGKLKVPPPLNAYSPDMRDSLDKFLHDNISLPS